MRKWSMGAEQTCLLPLVWSGQDTEGRAVGKGEGRGQNGRYRDTVVKCMEVGGSYGQAAQLGCLL